MTVQSPSAIALEAALTDALPQFALRHEVPNSMDIQDAGTDTLTFLEAPVFLPSNNTPLRSMTVRLWPHSSVRYNVSVALESLKDAFRTLVLTMPGQVAQSWVEVERSGPFYDEGVGAWVAYIQFQFNVASNT